MTVEREPCACEACVIAGVSHRPQRLDPRTGHWLHGRELAGWYRAYDEFRRLAARVKAKEMPK